MFIEYINNVSILYWPAPLRTRPPQNCPRLNWPLLPPNIQETNTAQLNNKYFKITGDTFQSNSNKFSCLFTSTLGVNQGQMSSFSHVFSIKNSGIFQCWSFCVLCSPFCFNCWLKWIISGLVQFINPRSIYSTELSSVQWHPIWI